MMRRSVTRDMFRILALGAMLLALWSCGKKGPPVAPRQLPPPQVVDLAAELQGQTITLHWTQPMERAQAAGFRIYRAATALDNSACTDCPLLFQKTGEMEAMAGRRAYRFSEVVKPGFRYTYKVRPYFTFGGQGPYSNPATVQVLP
jgi:predicted small lipoprotein YifL